MLRLQQQQQLLGAACGHLRGLSTSGQGVVEEMISYARQNFKGAHDQAMDIVKSGLSYMTAGPDAGRLMLVQAEIEADRSRWPEVADLARLAATAASDAEPTSPEEALRVAEVELAASALAARAHLVKRGAEAFTAAQTCMEVARKSLPHKDHEEQRWRGLVTACSVVGMVQHAAADFEVAAESFEQLQGRIELPPASSAPAAAAPAAPLDAPLPAHAWDHLVAPALKQGALFALAQADAVVAAEPPALGRAAGLAARAAAGAARAAEASAGGATGVFQSPVFCGEALADAHLADAQVSMHEADWDAAEAKLSKALSAAEAISSESNPRVALVLLLLGQVYSRSARVTLAEGLYRECSKMLQISPSRADDVELNMVHPSIGALLAWRFSQLLTALPNRSTEAGAWHKMAASLYEDSPIGRQASPESVFGGLEVLKGKGEPGLGVVMDLMCRRALPRQH